MTTTTPAPRVSAEDVRAVLRLYAAAARRGLVPSIIGPFPGVEDPARYYVSLAHPTMMHSRPAAEGSGGCIADAVTAALREVQGGGAQRAGRGGGVDSPAPAW